MDDDVLIIGALVVGYLLLRKGTVSVTTASAIPSASGNLVIPGNGMIPPASGLLGPSSVSAGYQVTPASVRLGTFGVTTGWSLPAVPAPPPPAAPPPPYYGGAAGTVGSGGNGLGSSLRAGISLGTGTSGRVIPLAKNFTAQVQDAASAPVVIA